MIGIMSDSHDNLEAINKAVKIFNKQDLELIIHAGDLISPFTSSEFEKLDAKLLAVYGNNDGEREGLKTAYENICTLRDFHEIIVDNRTISVVHGTDQPIVDALAESGKYDVVVRGHTHRLEISRGKSMIINPGETCGYITGSKTLILLDTDELSFEIINF